MYCKHNIKIFSVFLKGHKERVRTLEGQLKCLGEEPNSRAKKSSSGSDTEFDWLSGLEIKLKEAETNLQQEKEQRQKIEKEFLELKATKCNKTEVRGFGKVVNRKIFIFVQTLHLPFPKTVFEQTL